MQIPCIYLPGPAPAVSVANRSTVRKGYKNGWGRGKRVKEEEADEEDERTERKRNVRHGERGGGKAGRSRRIERKG